MSNGAYLFLVFLLVLVIVFVIIAVIIRSNLPAPPDPRVEQLEFLNQYNNVAIWGPNMRSLDTTRNTCYLYQFQGSMDFSSPQPRAVPANPSTNTQALNALTPLPQTSCFDVDQVAAAQVMHTCTQLPATTALQNGDGTTASLCIAQTGARVPTGTTDTYYTQNATLFDTNGNSVAFVACTSTPCNGTLSLLALNYVTDGSTQLYNNALCITTDDVTFAGVRCDLSDQNQLVRVVRQPAPNASSGQATQDASRDGRFGVLCRLYFRLRGTYYDVNSTQTGLVLTTNTNFIWCLVGKLVGSSVTGPQQIVYVGKLTPDQQSTFNGQLSTDQLIQNIQSLNLLSIQLADTSSGAVIVAPYVTYPNSSGPTSQANLATFYNVNYNLFNATLFTTTASQL